MFLTILLSLSQTDPTPLSVSPVAAPVPILKFELLPRSTEKRPGNAAVGYYQGLLNRPARPIDPAKAQKVTELESRLESTPIEQLSARELTEALRSYQTLIRSADFAARYDRCDWQRENQLSGEGVFTLLPDIQQHRELARILTLRIRLSAAEVRFDEAVRGLKTGLQHAKHVGEAPSLLQLLVGLALVNVQLKRVEDVIQRPHAPNLYWALTTLPHPFVNPKPGLEGEEAFLQSVIPGLQAIESGIVSQDQAIQAIESLAKSFSETSEDRGVRSLTSKVGIVGYAALFHEQARKELVERGRKAAELESYPTAQIVLLRGIATYRELLDDRMAWFSIPYPVAVERMNRSRKRLTAIKDGNDPLATLFTLGLPAFDKVFESHARTERRIALLRCVEAVRLHAAMNGGQLPVKLAEITAVPIPDDPVTLAPFAYSSTGRTATIVAPAPVGESANVGNTMSYVVTLRK